MEMREKTAAWKKQQAQQTADDTDTSGSDESPLTILAQEILSGRTLIGTAIICVLVALSFFGLSYAIYTPCVSAYYEYMPVHPQAELVEDTGHWANYFGFGDLNRVYAVPLDPAEARSWYGRQLGTARREARRNPAAPPAWSDYGMVIVDEAAGGTEVMMYAECYYNRVGR